jgi:hypothetical protein
MRDTFPQGFEIPMFATLLDRIDLTAAMMALGEVPRGCSSKVLTLSGG